VDLVVVVGEEKRGMVRDGWLYVVYAIYPSIESSERDTDLTRQGFARLVFFPLANI